MEGTTFVDTIYEWIGFQVAAKFHDTIWTTMFCSIPMAVFAGSFFFTIVQAIRKHEYEKVPYYLSYVTLITWLIWPQTKEFGMRFYSPDSVDVKSELGVNRAMGKVTLKIPRVVGWVLNVTDRFVATAIGEIQNELGEQVKDFNRLGALVADSRIHDPKVEESLDRLVQACYAPALTMRAKDTRFAGVVIADPENIIYDPGLRELYKAIEPAAGVNCHAIVETFIHDDLAKELNDNPHHRYVINRLCSISEKKLNTSDLWKLYEVRVVKNTIMLKDAPPSMPNELFFATTTFKPSRSKVTATDVAWASTPVGNMVTGNEGSVVKIVKAVGETFTDAFATMGRHMAGYAMATHVVAFGPAIYGLVQMIILSIFPFVAVAAFLPNKTIYLVRWFKILLGVKLWPIFWNILECFYNGGTLAGVLTGTEAPSSALLLACTMYLLTPAISVGVVELSSSFTHNAMGQLASIGQHAASAAVASLAGIAMKLSGSVAGGLGRAAGSFGPRLGAGGGAAARGGGGGAGGGAAQGMGGDAGGGSSGSVLGGGTGGSGGGGGAMSSMQRRNRERLKHWNARVMAYSYA